MSLHIRLLWGQLDAKDIAEDPPATVVTEFGRHCSTEEQLYQFRSPQSRQIIDPTLVKIGTSDIIKGGRLANAIRLVEEHLIHYIQAYLSRFGLLRWCPDLRQSPYSLYNSACRIVAIDTFKQAIVSHAYDHYKPKRCYIDDMELLIKIYDHLVHHFHFSRYQREVRKPGSVRATDDASPSYHSRKRVCCLFFDMSRVL